MKILPEMANFNGFNQTFIPNNVRLSIKIPTVLTTAAASVTITDQ
ncbi:MAG: hypothetical protein ACI8WW_001368 [Oceanospirillaceae bacterium]